jgi:YbbR domain-containing protein
MFINIFRWFLKNIRTLLLSAGLALVVWVSAVTAADPFEVRVFRGLPLETVGKAPDMLVMSNIPQTINVTLYAPRSFLDRYSNQTSLMRATLDLSGLSQGTHRLDIQFYPALSSTRIERLEPASLDITLDRLVNEERPVRLDITGRTARGYQAEPPRVDFATATISGAETLVSQVSELVATLDITNADEDIVATVALLPLDASGVIVNGVKISPETVTVTQPITLLGGYRNVVVRVVTEGQIASGYRLTNMSVSPPSVTVFSSIPQLVNDLPGFVETEPLDLTDLSDDLDVRLALNLPPNVSVVGEQNVLVQVSVAAIESSLSISVPVEIIGLGSGLDAQVAPDTVNVILSGPVLLLETLSPTAVRVLVDLSDLETGIYQIVPGVSILPERVQVESILPETLEVTITIGGTPTATPTPGTSPGATPTP